MTSKDMCYWLQGFFELSETSQLSPKQTEIIKNHLKLVFYHEIDPSYSSDPDVQEKMQNIHDGKNKTESQSKPTSELIVKC